MTKPDWFDSRMAATFGSTLYGGPKVRVVWAADQRDHLGRPKYLTPEGKPVELWAIERWAKPEFFGDKSEWGKTRFIYDDVHQKWVDSKGDFPSRGRYILITYIQDNKGGFLPLSDRIFDAIRQKIYLDEAFAQMSVIERNKLIQSQQDAKDAHTAQRTENAQSDTDDYYSKQPKYRRLYSI